MKHDKLDPFSMIKFILSQAGLTNEDYARHTGLWKKNVSMQRLLNEDAACKYLGGVSTPTFYRWVKAGKIPQVALGEKLRRYDIKDLDRFIKKSKRQTALNEF